MKAALFVTVNVMVVVPTNPVPGVTVTVRVAPEPTNTIFAFCTNVVLLDTPVTVKAVIGVTLSPSVKANAPVVVLMPMP